MAAEPEPTGITGPEVIQHLNRTITWYEHVSAPDPSAGIPQDVLLADNVRQTSRLVIRKAFEFARGQAAFLANQKSPAATSSTASLPGQARTLEQSALAANQRIQGLQAQIDELNQQIAKAPRRKLSTLTAQRDTLAADLSFAKAAQSSLRDMLRFASGAENGGLAGQINLLANSDGVPAALNTGAAPALTAPRASDTSSAIHPETAGIAALIGNCLQLVRARSQIDSLVRETDKLNAAVIDLRAPLRTKIREMLTRGDAIASTAATETDPQKLDSERQQVERMTSRFKAFSGTILPLNEQGIALGTTKGALAQWREAVSGQLQTVFGYLAFRLGTLGAAVIILLIISEVVRRATFRYVRDTRRRRQFVLIRRFVVAIIALLIVVLASVSGIGSFATVAGFVTAGLAVALQNVILSVVAYFFLIGRYGLRTGDRVTVSGVSGQVIEVGLVRLYLMELAGAGSDLHTTGRVAVFSNSVIFQPAALIKQAPGTEYMWHAVSVTFAAETDLEEARSKMARAVESVFELYQKSIETQHRAFERTANMQFAAPAPVARARFTDAGVEVTVRYPVEIHAMSEQDERVVRAIEAAAKDPQLKLAAGGYPRIVAVA
jgi:small-conductance mechanosensitive channel